MKHKTDLRIINEIAVAPHAGAWIETPERGLFVAVANTSPPTRGRGLKRTTIGGSSGGCTVAPHAGAWIETNIILSPDNVLASRPPRGGVD